MKWSPEHDVFCSVDGKHKSYCTPEAYRGSTCWLFRNRGNGTFEDVTAKSGIFDSSSKVARRRHARLRSRRLARSFVANDTQPNKLYRNRRDGTFEDVAVQAGVAFSEDGKARAGMGVDVADFDNSGIAGIAITNFDDEMIGALPPGPRRRLYGYRAVRAGVGQASRAASASAAVSRRRSRRASRSARGQRAYRRDRSQYRGKPRLRPAAASVPERRKGGFHDVAAQVGGGFAAPKSARGLAYGDFDRDGDLDLLITTNQGPAYLYRND